MRKTSYICALLVLIFAVTLGGCNWAGRTAGKTKAKVEKTVESVEQSYHDGYEEEKAKEQ